MVTKHSTRDKLVNQPARRIQKDAAILRYGCLAFSASSEEKIVLVLVRSNSVSGAFLLPFLTPLKRKPAAAVYFSTSPNSLLIALRESDEAP